ncbi:MAG: DUF1501 domain-containing protein, partial [Planctomycetes bacterium]|nr:DUF1501 domain-containing protein [Planctomycetota bacterium]
ICEHLPKLAQMTDKYAIVRSVTQDNGRHTPMIYYTLTGYHTERPTMDNNLDPPQRTDFPHMGAVLAEFTKSNTTLPGYIAMPELAVRSSDKFPRPRVPLRGGGAGFLGAQHDPLLINGKVGTREAVPSLVLPKEVSAERFEKRAALLSLLDNRSSRAGSTEEFNTLRQRAVTLTGSANQRNSQTFSLEGEPARLRDRYGRHRFGQTMLLARRLTEAGVPMVAIHFNAMTDCDGWDTHKKNFTDLKELLPMVDQSLTALIEDLDQRGRLDETLIACMGEFGRTPKINKNAGRDHWGNCSTTVLAGGGIRGGQVFGSSDKIGAYPLSHPVTPADIQATMYHCMGLDPHQPMYDQFNRPWALSTGKVIEPLVS